jgi:hypothetical protein
MIGEIIIKITNKEVEESTTIMSRNNNQGIKKTLIIITKIQIQVTSPMSTKIIINKLIIKDHLAKPLDKYFNRLTIKRTSYRPNNSNSGNINKRNN